VNADQDQCKNKNREIDLEFKNKISNWKTDSKSLSEILGEPVLKLPGLQKMGFRITDREIDLLKFLVEMKFAHLKHLYKIFYWSEDSKGDSYARERVRLLIRAGLIKSKIISIGDPHLYFATPLGVRMIQKKNLEWNPIPPIRGIDYRVFDHDIMVLDSRMSFEVKGIAQEWISDRRMYFELFGKGEASSHELVRSEGFIPFPKRDLVPDGVFRSKKTGHRVAFELENTRKSKQRYHEKLLHYRYLIEGPTKYLDKVVWVTSRKNLYQQFLTMTLPFQNIFSVFSLDQIRQGEF